MKYYIKGKGDVSLSQHDFIFQGGEGKVYGKETSAYKIYDDLNKLIPEAKIKELSQIRHPNVIKPEDLILNLSGSCVGFTMKWIKQSVSLAKLFSSDFRKQNHITNQDAIELVEAIKEIIAAVHQAGCLIVDGNEFNYLVDDGTYKIPYVIDVDSFQTPSFPAAAIMPSIRDPHSSVFTELTDWYSFGIVACQIFVGIHPYKGNHPDYPRKILGNQVMAKRMQDNVSIFHPKTTMPPSARDVSCIPRNYLDWFMELFEYGRRLPPPIKPVPIVTASVEISYISGSQQFELQEIMQFDSDIVQYSTVNGVNIVKTSQQIYFGKSAYDAAPDTHIIFSQRKAKPVLVSIENHRVCFREIAETRGRILPMPLECSDIMVVDHALYVRNQGNFVELAAVDKSNGDIMIAVKASWQIMPNSSEVFKGVIYQNVLGKPYLLIPLPLKQSCINCFIPELEGCRILDAKHDNHVCMLIVHHHGTYQRMVIKFDKAYQTYHIRITEDIDIHRVNFTTLDSGVVVSIVEDGVVEIFSNHYDHNRIDIVKDAAISNELNLCRDGASAVCFKNNRLYSIKRKRT